MPRGPVAEVAGPFRGEGGTVGWVHGRPIERARLDDYLHQLASSVLGARLGLEATDGGGSPRALAMRRWAAKALLVDALMEEEARRLEIAASASFADWLQALERTGELVVAAPTEEEARACYRANPARFVSPEARRVRHLLAREEATARSLAAEVAGGRSLEGLAASCSADAGSRSRCGDLGWVERGQLAGPLEAAIFSAPLGRLVGPLRSGFGWHLLRVEGSRRGGVRPFAQCREELLAGLSGLRRREALLDWLVGRLASCVRVPNGDDHPLLAGLPGTAHRH